MNGKLIKTCCILLLAMSCERRPQADGTRLYVSIAPLKEIVGGITGDDFGIDVLVPAGASPETYEPTPRQIAALNRSQLIFNVGLIDFETALLRKIDEQKKIVNLSRGIETIAGSCSHGGHETSGHTHHAHGIDPHIWTSPKALQRMAANAYEAIHATYPDSAKYTRNYEQLQERLQELDASTAEKLRESGVEYFICPHLLCPRLRPGTGRYRSGRQGTLGAALGRDHSRSPC